MAPTVPNRFQALRRRTATATKATIASLVLITIIGFLALTINDRHGKGFAKRSPAPEGKLLFKKANEECRLVHSAPDQCAFVRRNCLDEEAGLLSYLELYFCKLPHARTLSLFLLLLWLGLLFSTIGIAASDFFSINLSTIASLLGLSESVAGVTFLAFGNGSPDVFSTFAAMSSNSGSLAIGELIGAAGFITAVVAGSMALVRPFKVSKQSFIRDVSFFVVASSFSMVFLADGYLGFWECAVMVVFYVAYVLFVVISHWVQGRKRHRKQMEARSRDHFNVPSNSILPSEPGIEDEADRLSSNDARRSLMDDFITLETAGYLKPDILDDDDQDEAREHWMSEISRNMRVQRPAIGTRRNTGNPIRPSLLGALEFRAVLSSLGKSRNHQAIPIAVRRYSDDPSLTLGSQFHRRDAVDNGGMAGGPLRAEDTSSSIFFEPYFDDDEARPNRVRAVSANDTHLLKASQSRQETDARRLRITTARETTADTGTSHSLTVPTLPEAVAPGQHIRSSEFSDVPGGNRSLPLDRALQMHMESQNGHENRHPGIKRQMPIHSTLLTPGTAGSSPAIPFPPYFDDPTFILPSSRPQSIRLPPPGLDPASYIAERDAFLNSKPLRWWPYRLLPPPNILASTLFPTLYSWKEKSISERVLGLVSAPMVFLLTITLPVVESEKEDYNIGNHPNAPFSGATTTPQNSGTLHAPLVSITSDIDDLCRRYENRPRTAGESQESFSGYQSLEPVLLHHDDANSGPEEEEDSGGKVGRGESGWNRWLVATQVFTAPFFVVFILWANIDEEHSSRRLLFYGLCSALGSSIVLGSILLTTSERKTPRYHSTLCFAGFVVSIAWIATIAGEVVGVLKALGVILGISDAILGLTIFAVGNSLGDLVADITVAKLGFPVMALSACFGGPMLNILLGIGLSGLYMTLKGGRSNGSSIDPIYTEPYHIEVGGTLIISGATLLITLVGLLVAVPLNRWVMDRKIGWSLVTLWTVSTITNVIVEVTGITRKLS